MYYCIKPLVQQYKKGASSWNGPLSPVVPSISSSLNSWSWPSSSANTRRAKKSPACATSPQAQVNPNTMQRALAELEARGLLETQRTAGRTVTGDVEKIAQTRRALAQTLVHHFYHQTAALGLTKAEIAALLEQEEA